MTDWFSAEAHAARTALRDCGVIRARYDHPGYGELLRRGLVNVALVPDDEDRRDFRLAR